MIRTALLAMFVAGAVLPASGNAAEPANADEAALLQIEALNDRWPDRWQGRHHYLFDDEYTPAEYTAGIQTVGASSARACGLKPVRVLRTDGKTAIVKLNSCD